MSKKTTWLINMQVLKQLVVNLSEATTHEVLKNPENGYSVDQALAGLLELRLRFHSVPKRNNKAGSGNQ